MNCPACQTPYNPGNRFCGRCGADLSPATAANPPAADPPHAATAADSPAADPPPSGLPVNPPPEFPTPAASFHPYASPSDATPAAVPGESWQPALRYTLLRVLAYIIDALIIPVPLVILWMLLGLPLPTWTDELFELPPGFQWLQLMSFSLALVYETALITLYAATVGKRLLGMYVVRTDGSRVGWGRALSRHLLKVLLASFPFITANFAFIILGLVFLAIVLMIALRQDKRGLHDLLCDTIVLRRPR